MGLRLGKVIADRRCSGAAAREDDVAHIKTPNTGKTCRRRCVPSVRRMKVLCVQLSLTLDMCHGLAYFDVVTSMFVVRGHAAHRRSTSPPKVGLGTPSWYTTPPCTPGTFCGPL